MGDRLAGFYDDVYVSCKFGCGMDDPLHFSVAADSASLAATEKLDQIVQEEQQRRMNAVMAQNQNRGKEPGDPGYVDPYYAVLGTPQKRQYFMESVIAGHKAELISTVRSYSKKKWWRGTW